MHLIEKMKDEAEPLVVHAHVSLEVMDQPGAGEVGLGVVRRRALAGRDQPFLADPDFERRAVDAGAVKELAFVEHRLTSPFADRTPKAATSFPGTNRAPRRRAA